MCLFLRASYMNPLTLTLGVPPVPIPPTVFLARRTASQQYSPFLLHYNGALVKSRSAMMGHLIEEQTGITGAERSLVSGALSAFQTIPLPFDETNPSGPTGNLIMVQTGSLPHPLPGFLPINRDIFKAHQDACGRDPRISHDSGHSWGRVDALTSVPIMNLLTLAGRLPPNCAFPPPLTCKDKDGLDIPLLPTFLSALSHTSVQAALRAGLGFGESFAPPSSSGLGGAGAVPLPPPPPSPPQLEDTLNDCDELSLIAEMPSHTTGNSKYFRLYISSIHTAHDLGVLRAARITTVVNCASDEMTSDLRLIDPLATDPVRAREAEIIVQQTNHGLPAKSLACCGGAHQPFDKAWRTGWPYPDLVKPAHWAPFKAQGIDYSVVYAQENNSPCQDLTVGWPAAFALLRDTWREGGSALIHC